MVATPVHESHEPMHNNDQIYKAEILTMLACMCMYEKKARGLIIIAMFYLGKALKKVKLCIFHRGNEELNSTCDELQYVWN